MADTTQGATPPDYGVPGLRGAIMSIDHKARTIPGHVVSENELQDICHSSYLLDLGLVVCTAAIGFAVGIKKDIILSGVSLSAQTKEAVTMVYWICGIAAVAGFLLALWQGVRRHRKIREITGHRSLLGRASEWRKKFKSRV